MTDKITLEELQTQINARRRFWQPYRDRADLWHLMVLLVDIVQLNKPAGVKRFVGAEPHATVMLGRSILARNQLQPHIPLLNYDDDEERKGSQDIERLIIGAFNDIDRTLFGRGMQNARSIAAMHLLIRGWAVSHLLIRKGYKKFGMRSPLDYEPWDMRFFLPAFDRRGRIHSCAYESFPSLSEVLEEYPDAVDGSRDWGLDINAPVTRIDWYDDTYHGVAIHAHNLPMVSSVLTIPSSASRHITYKWVKEPTEHGLDEIPVVCVSTNGLPFNNMPQYIGGGIAPPIAFNSMNPTVGLQRRPTWRQPGGYPAEWGRSILAAVEDLVPQYNETIANLMQILYNDAFGTWVTQTHAGDMTEVAVGGVNALRVGEGMARVAGISASPDLYKLLAILREAYQRGTFSDALFGLTEFQGSGFLQTQLRNAALNALDPYIESHKVWGSELAQKMLSQLRQARGIKWRTTGVTSTDLRQFHVEVSSDMVKKDWPVQMKSIPALPDDMALRVDIAKRMLDPNMPLASYQTVLDRVLEFGDAQKERDLIFEDMADRDPVIVFLRIQNRLRARGLDELADMFGEKSFATAFVEQMTRIMMMKRLQQAMQVGATPGMGMEENGMPGAPVQNEDAGFGPQTLPPEAAVGPTESVDGSTGPVV